MPPRNNSKDLTNLASAAAPIAYQAVKSRLPPKVVAGVEKAKKYVPMVKEAVDTAKMMRKQKMGVGAAVSHVAARALTGRKIKEDGFPGENHGIIEMPDGSYERAAFMGPGTQVIKRLQRGDKGKSPVDRIARRHDIDYSLATTPEEVRAADQRMMNSIRSLNQGQERGFNIAQAKLIAPKMLAEKITGKTFFNDLKGPRNQAEKQILMRGL